MSILVTGGAGFIGSNLVRMLVEAKGESVINLDKLTYAGRGESLAELEGHPQYVFEAIDLCDAKALKEVFQTHQPHAVMHLAAESHVDRSIAGPGEFIQSNIVGTYQLLEASLEYWRRLPVEASVGGAATVSVGAPTQENFRFLHVSTDEVYGSLAPEAGGFSETTAYDPHSPYAASKAAADHLVRAWGHSYGLPVLVTNSSNNYGPYQFPEKLIPVVISKCLRGEPIPVYGSGENIRDWLCVSDHTEALYAVLTRGRVGETYNVGSNHECANIELVRTLCGLLDEWVPSKLSAHPVGSRGTGSYQDLITFVTDRPGHDLRYAIDSSKLRAELGWAPQEELQSGLRKTVRWYLENQDWWRDILEGCDSGGRSGGQTESYEQAETISP